MRRLHFRNKLSCKGTKWGAEPDQRRAKNITVRREKRPVYTNKQDNSRICRFTTTKRSNRAKATRLLPVGTGHGEQRVGDVLAKRQLLERHLGRDGGQQRYFWVKIDNRSVNRQSAPPTDPDGEAGRHLYLAEHAQLVDVLEGRDQLQNVQQPELNIGDVSKSTRVPKIETHASMLSGNSVDWNQQTTVSQLGGDG